MRATQLYAMLRARGCPGSAVQVRRYVRTVRPASLPPGLTASVVDAVVGGGATMSAARVGWVG